MLNDNVSKYNNIIIKIKYGNLQISKKEEQIVLEHYLLRISGDIVSLNFHLICLYYTAIRKKINLKNALSKKDCKNSLFTISKIRILQHIFKYK